MTLRFRLDGVDMGDTVVRLRDGIDGLTEAADGSVAFAGVQIEDPAGSLDLVGWHLFTVDEDACSQPRIFTGYLAARNISRGAYRTGAGRIWDCDVVDLNALLHLTALQKIRDDAMRPSETGTARINWLMGTLGMDGVIFDNGKVEANAWTYDETDYRGQYADDVLRDIVSASGIGRWTFFVYWDGSAAAGEEVSLFYGELASTTYDSTLAISNVLSDVDSSTTFAPSIDATLERDPSDQYGGVYVTATFGRIYRTDPVTIAAMGITSPSGETLTRDGTYTSARLINAETANRHAATYLDWHSVEVDKITYEVILPKASVNLLGAGMRAGHRFAHLPDYETEVMLRITRRTVLLTDNNPDYYRVQVEASLKGVLQTGAGDPGGLPLPAAGCGDVTFVRATRDDVVSVTDRWVEFGSAVENGHLVLVYSVNEGAADSIPPTAPDGWTECLFLAPYEGNKSPGKLFAKICDGGDDFNASGVPGRVGPFGHQSSAGLVGIEVSGVNNATPTYTSVEATVDQPSGAYNHTQNATASKSSFIVMVQQGEFGDEYVFSAVSPSLETEPPPFTGNPGQTFTLVYRIAGPGSIPMTVRTEDNTSSMWRQSAVAVFECDSTAVDNGPEPGQWVFNETPTPPPGGGNTVFFTANPYASGSLQVFVDLIDHSAAVTESDPETGEFTLAFDPRSDETILVNYQGR